MLLRYRAQIDQCVHMLNTRKEMIERYEKQVAGLFERARDRRVLQNQVDEFNALIFHECQLVQPIKEQLASLMRELQEKRECVRDDRLDQEVSSSSPPRRAKKGRYQK